MFFLLFAAQMAFAQLNDGHVVSAQAYTFPAFEDSGFVQTPDIKEYYESVVKNKFEKATAKTGIERIDYLSDGLKVKGFILKPLGASSAAKKPILVFNRGGNRDYGKLGVVDLAWLAKFSEKGFVVVASQYRGNDGGEGQDEFGGSDVHDVLNIIKVAKAIPEADATQIFIMGHSRGGMQTYLTIKASSEIRAAAVLSGECDLPRGLIGWPDFEKNVYAQMIPDYYQKKDQALSERSACNWPEKIKVPVLLFQGTNDKNVEPVQATEMADKLKAVGTAYSLQLIEGEDHNFYFRDQYVDQIVKQVADWFQAKSGKLSK